MLGDDSKAISPLLFPRGLLPPVEMCAEHPQSTAKLSNSFGPTLQPHMSFVAVRAATPPGKSPEKDTSGHTGTSATTQ